MTDPAGVVPSRPSVTLPPLASPVDELWHVLLDLAEQLTVPWTIVGGQMVLLHALEHGRVPPQVSQDGDVLADVRSSTGAIRAVVMALETAGFHVDGMSPTHLAHRYVRRGSLRPVTVDVLAPEGLGPRADLTTTRPGRTIEVPGGTQALSRTELSYVQHDGRTGTLPRPSLLAATVGKAAACGLPGNTDRHRDLALLYALIRDPFAMRQQLTPKDSKRLRIAGQLRDPRHPGWMLVPADIRDQGRQAYDILCSDG